MKVRVIECSAKRRVRYRLEYRYHWWPFWCSFTAPDGYGLEGNVYADTPEVIRQAFIEHRQNSYPSERVVELLEVDL
jgi:hypothetical protein